MRERIGEEFAGIVSGVTSAGLFVEIDDPYVEGLVKSDRLDEDYELNDKTLRYETPKNGASIGLGDSVRVRIDSVSVPQRRIELSLLSAPSAKSAKSKRSREERPISPKERSYREDKPTKDLKPSKSPATENDKPATKKPSPATKSSKKPAKKAGGTATKEPKKASKPKAKKPSASVKKEKSKKPKAKPAARTPKT